MRPAGLGQLHDVVEQGLVAEDFGELTLHVQDQVRREDRCRLATAGWLCSFSMATSAARPG